MGLFKKSPKQLLEKGKNLKRKGSYEEALAVFDAVEGSHRAFAEDYMYECCMALYERTGDPEMRNAARDHLICAAKGGILTAPALLANQFGVLDYLTPYEREQRERLAELDKLFAAQQEKTSE